MLPAQDHKRIFDQDKGPNTGGMGAYCPCPLLTDEQYEYVRTDVLEKSLKGFQKDGIKYTGVLYSGLMLTPNGPKVLEFNCRFGDPETEVILPLLESDLYEIMLSCCDGTLESQPLKWKENVNAVGVVMASRGYPETSSKGQIIKGTPFCNQLLQIYQANQGVPELMSQTVRRDSMYIMRENSYKHTLFGVEGVKVGKKNICWGKYSKMHI